MSLLDGIREDTVASSTTTPVTKRSRSFSRRASRTCSSTEPGQSPSHGHQHPPHNLGEVVDATVHLIDHPQATPTSSWSSSRTDFRPRADHGRQGIIDAYRTGKGSIRVRASRRSEEGSGRSGDEIVVTEMPFQTVDPVTAAHQGFGRVPRVDGLADVNGESAKGKTRLVIR